MLKSQPSSNVVLQISSDNTSEVIVSPDNLTFTTSNWNTLQTVTLTGVDDNAVDSNTNTQILVKVDNLSTVDQRYHGINQSLAVTNVDNETTPAARYGETLRTGGNHTCAVLDNGSVMCWGYNANGNLGNGNSGTGTDNATPDSVVNLSNARSINLAKNGNHSCTVLDNNSAMCWGFNNYGQLG